MPDSKATSKATSLIAWVMDHQGDVDFRTLEDECRHVLVEACAETGRRTPRLVGLPALDVAECILRLPPRAAMLADCFPYLPGAKALRDQ